jgi:hypothetical protein
VYLWTTNANWSGNQAPGVNDDAVFDGSGTNLQDCTLDANKTVLDLVFKNDFGNKLTISSAKLTVSDHADLGDDTNNGVANIDFAGTSPALQINGADGSVSHFNNIDFSDAHGTVYDNGAKIQITARGFLAATSYSDFDVSGTGSELLFKNTTELILNNGASIINHTSGTVTINPVDDLFLGATLDGSSYINNQGTLQYLGATGDTSTMQVAVANSGQMSTSAGTLIVSGRSSQIANGYSIYQSAGGTTIKQGSTLQATYSYRQTAGTLACDASAGNKLKTVNAPGGGAGDKCQFDGGTIQISNSPDMETFTLDSSSVNFAGGVTYKAKIKPDGTANDQLNITGSLNITGTNTLIVTTNNGQNVQAGKTWTIIHTGTGLTGTFTGTLIQKPAGTNVVYTADGKDLEITS